MTPSEIEEARNILHEFRSINRLMGACDLTLRGHRERENRPYASGSLTISVKNPIVSGFLSSLKGELMQRLVDLGVSVEDVT